MGDPKFSRKKYASPSHPWQKARIERETTLKKKYGLKNRKEIWKSETILRGFRSQSRLLLARSGEEQAEKEKQQLLNKVINLGLLPLESNLDDILALDVEKVISRRLQTLVYLHGLSSTTRQARQLIIHGHISIGGRKVRVPSYMVRKNEEDTITYSQLSPLNEEEHPVRPKADMLDEFSEKTREPKPQEKPKETKPQEKPKETKPQEKPKETKPQEKPKKLTEEK
jgi:small subunit ribosomal protein S4